MKPLCFPLLLLFLFNHYNMADSKPNTQFSLWQLIDGETKVIQNVFFFKKKRISDSALDYFKNNALDNKTKINLLLKVACCSSECFLRLYFCFNIA